MPSMEENPVQVKLILELFLLVQRIAYQGMAISVKMNADLMGAAARQSYLQISVIGKSF